MNQVPPRNPDIGKGGQRPPGAGKNHQKPPPGGRRPPENVCVRKNDPGAGNPGPDPPSLDGVLSTPSILSTCHSEEIR